MARIKVYRAINVTKQEVYHGISENVEKRKNGFHCKGGTKALKHWDCSTDKIIWKEVSQHNIQKKASKKAHDFEKEYKHHKGFANIKTAGK